MVVLMDPAEDPDDILRANRSREKQFVFDCTFDGVSTQVCFVFLVVKTQAHTLYITMSQGCIE
jgi:kinesin family protein 18/19